MTVCEKCNGSGYLVLENNSAGECQCLRPSQFARNMKLSGIPLRFWNPDKDVEASLSRYKHTTPVEKDSFAVVKAWVAGVKTSREWLTLYGPVGTCKSYLASALLIELCRKYGATVRFITVFDLLAEIRKEFNSDGSMQAFTENGVYDQVCEVGLLAIDDLGNAKASDFAVDQVSNLIDTRWREKRPTILTTNLGLDALRDVYGERFISRVKGAGPVLQFNGKDRRLLEVGR